MNSLDERFVASDGLQLYGRRWLPEGRLRGSALLVHGLGEHSGRYQALAQSLVERRLAVYAYDHRGHGRSAGRRGWVARFGDFLDDLALVHRSVVSAQPGLPLFLIGHSMGGLIVTAYLLEKSLKPDFVVLSGPAIVPLIGDDDGIDPTRLSRDEAVQRAYLEDPLILREKVDKELYHRLADGLALLPGRASQLRLPLLLIHGSADRLCSAEGARRYLEASGSAQLEIKLYDGGRHEMFNETNREEVFADLGAWIEKRLAETDPDGADC
ncbi:MAG: alpha/beta hydrolase [Candidatus Binatia bacterium]